MLQFAYTIFYVKDVVKSIEFYEKAFGMQRKFIAPNEEYGEMLTGDTTLGFATLEMADTNIPLELEISEPAKKTLGMEIGFTATDVPAAIQQAVNAGATLVAEPKEKPWGQTVGYIRDLNGFLVEICTPMG